MNNSLSQSKNSLTSSLIHKRTIIESNRIQEDLKKVQDVLKDNLIKKSKYQDD